LRDATEHALGFLDGLDTRHVGATASLEALRTALDIELAEEGVAPEVVLAELAGAADEGLVASAGPRYFGFVVGGAQPIALATDWLASAWDQMAGLYASSPAAAVVEEVCSRWILGVLGLPFRSSVGFVTGCQMANFTALAAARHEVLARAGWDVETHGLSGAPQIDVLVGEQAHATIFTALRMLGLGAGRARKVPADDQGRMLAPELRRMLAETSGPAIVCAQAGEVNTGAFDPLEEIASAARERGAWLHVDGAFGLWAAASASRRHLVAGAERADSWATDAHKWLNVPYDSGLVIVAHPDAHRAAMALSGAYLAPAAGSGRDNTMYVPEASRRARGFAVYATLRALGRQGVEDLVDRCCGLAARMAGELNADPRLRVVNDVVLNQILVKLDVPADDLADATAGTISRVQQDGTCWVGGTVWMGEPAIRVSISNWSTQPHDVDRSAAAIARAAAQAIADRETSTSPSSDAER
jgi:glutamate/tyrosine decarboxylase-like PLP-dependent enzyme